VSTVSELTILSKSHYELESADIKITVLGGIKLESLQIMRATLKVESRNQTIRHNLDLYNDTQVTKLVRKVAERLEIGTSVVAQVVADLTNQLEKYRLEAQKEKQAEVYQSPALTPTEQRVAADFLKEPNLLERTNELIGQSGVIGEETNRLLMYLIFTSRKTTQPLHVVSLGASGSGKTHLQEKVGELIPEQDKVEITTLSENAFYYFGQQELRNKLILIEDLDGAENALYPLRELQSKKRISKTVAHKNSQGETKTIHLTVEGPVSVAGCTTKEQIYEDNANRSFLLYLDESEEQDKKIMNYQRAVSAGRINHQEEKEAAQLLCNTQRLLEPIKIVNPFAEKLDIPQEVFKPRRTNSHYLQFIEVVTFYHQHQRGQKADPVTGEVFIETTLEDIAAANSLLKETLLRKSDELSGATRNYFERLKSWLESLPEPEEGKAKTFTQHDIRQQFRLPGTTVRRHQLELLSIGLVRIESGKKHTGYRYEIVNTEEYSQLQSRIASVLDQALEKLRRATEPTVSHTQNGSPKKQKVNKLNPVSQ